MLTMSILASLAIHASLLVGPPPTKVDPVVDRVHGETITDAYRWLEALESESEAVRAWTDAQNDYTRNILDALPHRKAIESRLRELMEVGSISAPEMRGGRYFYTERRGDQNQAVLYVREGPDAEPRALIDPNTLDAQGLYALDWFEPNPRGDLLAFGLSHAGDEMTVLYLMDVATGEWLADHIEGKVQFTGWAPDGRSFTYGVLTDPSNAYSREFRYHEIGRHERHDPVILRQDAPSRIPHAGISRDGRWLVMAIFEGWAKQEVYVADADRWRRTGEVERIPITEGLEARFAPEVVHGDMMYLFTTLDAPNGMLYAVDLNNPAREHWEVVIPERDDAVLQGVAHARGMLVASYEKDAVSQFEVFDMAGESLGGIDLPGAGLGSASVSTHHDRTEAFLTYTSFNEPRSIYHFDLEDEARAMTLWERPDVPVDPSIVDVKQRFATSKDGTKVPMFIVHRKGLELDGGNPTVIYGYGGFNISLTPWFSATRFPWYEAGGVFVVANLRGGSEYGEAWHQAGMLGNKQNVFDDLYAVAEHLIDGGYTSPEHLGVQGGSNGGLLTGVAATQRPDLFAVVVSNVPLLDMLRYPGFLMAKFWIPEYGDPENPEHFKWLRAYSPYHNIEEGETYPAMLITAGENDNRVHPMHARKMVAKLQSKAANDFEADPILLWVEREAGHGAGKPLWLRVRDVADQHMFLAWQTGLLENFDREADGP